MCYPRLLYLHWYDRVLKYIDNISRYQTMIAQNKPQTVYMASPLIARFMGPTRGPIWGRQDPNGPHVGPLNFITGISTVSSLVFGMKSLNNTKTRDIGSLWGEPTLEWWVPLSRKESAARKTFYLMTPWYVGACRMCAMNNRNWTRM